MKELRLDKYLADLSVGTRKEVKKIIRSGVVHVNGKPVSDPQTHIRGEDVVELEGKRLVYEEFVYYMLNKPAGVLSACSDKNQQTVIDLIGDSSRRDLFPVGRLDKDTEGLLLITNDGVLAHRLLSPNRHVAKVYYAQVLGRIGRNIIRLFADGLKMDEQWTAKPAKLEVLDTLRETYDTVTIVRVTIYEGKYHQVRRMFEAVGSEVIYLKRLMMGPLELDEALNPGDYRRLTEEELSGLKHI